MVSPRPPRGQSLVFVSVVGTLLLAPVAFASAGSAHPLATDTSEAGLPHVPARPVTPERGSLDLATLSAPGPGQTIDLTAFTADSHGSRILMRCQTEPGRDQGRVPVPDPQGEVGTTRDRTLLPGCPARVVDDGFAFADIDLAVHPEDPEARAFTALHGPPTGNGATDRARTGQTHTVFQAPNGDDWTDHPTDRGEGVGVGEGAATTVDAEGNVYVALLWSSRSADGYKSHIKTYKGPPADMGWDRDRLYGSGSVYDPFANEPFVASVDLVTTQAPRGERIVLISHTARGHPPVEVGADNHTTETPRGRYLEAAWTDTRNEGGWVTIQPGLPVGPCDAISEGAVVGPTVYVACRVGTDYDHRARAVPGEIDIFAIDPFAGTIRLIGPTPLIDGQPRLGANPDGYMAITNHHLVDGELFADMAFGWDGAHWVRPRMDLGMILRHTVEGGAATDADITAIAVTPGGGVHGPPITFVVYKHWGVSGQGPADTIRKSIVAFDECQGPQAALALADSRPFFEDYVTQAKSTNEEDDEAERTLAMVNDQRDSLEVVRHPTGPRLHFAIGDHGVAQVGELLPEGIESYCFPPGPPPFIPTLAAPQATALGTTANTIVGATVSLAAFAMVGHLLTAKRRSAHAATVGDERP